MNSSRYFKTCSLMFNYVFSGVFESPDSRICDKTVRRIGEKLYHILHLVHLQLMYSNPGHWDFITMRAYLWELKLFAIGFAWLMQSQLSFPSAFPCPFVASTCPENSFLWPWQCQYCRPVQEISCGRIFWSSVSCSNAILLSQIFLWLEWTLSWNLFICIRISIEVLQLSGFSE